MSVEVEPMEQVVQNQDGGQNGNALFSMDSSENVPVKEDRVIRKAKRTIKKSASKDDGIVNSAGLPGNVANPKGTAPFSKNSRKSRNGYGRGAPKKGGAGGKGVWGKLGDEFEYVNGVPDKKDPNYDSDSTENVVIRKVELQLEGPDLEKAVTPVIREFFEHGDTGEVMESLGDMNIAQPYKIPEVAVSLALEHHNPQREMTSRLISDIYGDYLDQTQIAKAFNNMLHSLGDLSLDTPDAPTVLGQFIARAVADDCLPPKFVSSYKGQLECPMASTAIDKADVLLSMKHGIVRLDDVWGVCGGNRPVKYLIRRMNLLLKEYLSSGDISEATRCLKELDVPHFHHELVYEAVLMSIEESTDRASEMMVSLLQSLCKTNIVTPDQLYKGVKRIFDEMPDICIDVPAAYNVLEKMGDKMYQSGVLPKALYMDMPARGRKRFVSEGDGGRIKADEAGTQQ